jgi:hypothetical protein
VEECGSRLEDRLLDRGGGAVEDPGDLAVAERMPYLLRGADGGLLVLFGVNPPDLERDQRRAADDALDHELSGKREVGSASNSSWPATAQRIYDVELSIATRT